MAAEYRYRRYVRWLPIFVGTIFILVAVLFVVLIAVVLWVWTQADLNNAAHVAALREWLVTCGLHGAVLLQSGLTWHFCRGFASVRIVVEDDALFYRHRRGEKRLPFDDRMMLRFIYVPYLGGAFVVSSGKQKITVQDSFENKAELLRQVKAALDIRGLSAAYDAHRLFQYIKASEFADQLWERFWGGLWKLAALMFASGMLGGYLESVHAGGVRPSSHWLIASIVWPPVLAASVEVIFARRLNRLADPESCSCPARDPAWERDVYRRAFALGWAAYLTAAAAALLFSR